MIRDSLDLVIFTLEIPQHLVDLQHEVMEVRPLHLEFRRRCLDEDIHEHLQRRFHSCNSCIVKETVFLWY